MSRAQMVRLADGRLHLNDGPIDLIILAEGRGRAEAEAAAIARFPDVLDELCAELPLLRRQTGPMVNGPIARRMRAATLPFAADDFITPMAAVAGAVAEEILSVMTEAGKLCRALVNNGGDIAFHLAGGQCFRAGLVDRPDRPSLFARSLVTSDDRSRGMATSGWRGRSFSLGIADAVTVLAETASQADAAATIIANAVDLPGHPAILRRPACELQPDSDLGDRLVTRGVGALSVAEIATALASGLAVAADLKSRGLIADCALHLAGVTRTLGHHQVQTTELSAHA